MCLLLPDHIKTGSITAIHLILSSLCCLLSIIFFIPIPKCSSSISSIEYLCSVLLMEKNWYVFLSTSRSSCSYSLTCHLISSMVLKNPNQNVPPLSSHDSPLPGQFWNVYLMKLISAISGHFHFCPFLFVLSLYLQLLLDLKGPPSIPHLQKIIELLEVNQFYWTRKEVTYCARPISTHPYWTSGCQSHSSVITFSVSCILPFLPQDLLLFHPHPQNSLAYCSSHTISW